MSPWASQERNVLVDTPVWSLALRRKAAGLKAEEKAIHQQLIDLIQAGRVQMMGPIRQEILTGIREQSLFTRIRDFLRSFDEPGIDLQDYEEAARMHNVCRTRGMAASPIDVLICAVAHRRSWRIFTLDRDFNHYARVLAIKLYRAI
jgi:predicted nucleic acid-binding protein